MGKGNGSIPGAVLMGILAVLTWTLAASAVLAWLVLEELLKESALGYGILVILIAGGWLAAWVTWRKLGRQRAMAAGLSAAGYFLLLLAMNALFFGGQYQAVGVTALAIIGGAGGWLLLGMGPKKRKGKGSYKIRRA